MGKGFEKLMGSYTSPQKRWNDNNKEYKASYDSAYSKANRERIYANRNARKQKEKNDFFRM